MRDILIAGNWKMYKTEEESVAFIKELVPKIDNLSLKIYLAVPFTSIKACADESQNTPIVIGAQNMNDATEGAFTGEISASMLHEAGAKFVILGHSERRHIFNETNEFINKKIQRALKDNLQPILCIGETLEQREDGKTEEIIKTQLAESLNGVTPEQIKDIVIAYEPVWAIGTGKTATPEIAQEAHRHCRQIISEIWGQEIGDNLTILYGGSVKSDNAATLMEEPDIDGLLIGGASLDVESFNKILHYQTVKTEI